MPEEKKFANIPPKFLKAYDAKDTEKRIYETWEKSGFFNPDKCIEKGATKEDAETFSIVLPPPNVTGTLHTGHASMLAIEDIMVRFERMRGKKTLWLPGTDHAAIATQSKVEKELQKEKITRHDLGREEFLKRVNDFAKSSHDTIVSQVRKMGASVDWSREAYTLDEIREKAVRTAFKKMYDEGLIYRGYRIVNFDPKGQTTISDDEIVYEERVGKLYTFKYSKDVPFSIATTRPETKLGDTAVAVNPEDPRYKDFIGKTYKFDFAGTPVEIKVVGDSVVEKEFGTGVVGVTPAHSVTDWEIGKRHDLRVVPVINEYGKMTVGMEGVKDEKTTVAREKIIEWLKSEGLFEKEEDIKQNIGTAERTGGIIEPLPKLQWFIDVNKKTYLGKSLKELMLEAVSTKEIKILPEHFERVYFHWIENLRDWNISRQIWFGHRIPVWYRTKSDNSPTDAEIYCGITAPEGDDWKQDEDTLDTWFSSGLWTFSTLGWPEETKDFKTYHPTTILETGYDILFFWVARMVLMSKYLLNEIPFKTVYLHGLVRDAQGRKMSKSLGNIVDPVDLIEKYSADALRMALIVGIGPGSDNNLSEDKIKAYSKFANKIWNATRFVLENTENINLEEKIELEEKHQNFISEWKTLIAELTKELEEYKLYLVGEKLYHFFWHRFADVIIEECKADMSASAKYTLLWLLKEQIKALHPFMPFVTEEIWNLIHNEKPEKLLIIEEWPI